MCSAGRVEFPVGAGGFSGAFILFYEELRVGAEVALGGGLELFMESLPHVLAGEVVGGGEGEDVLFE